MVRDEPALSSQQKRLTSSAGGMQLYREMTASGSSLPLFIYQELITTLFSSLSGLIGIALRTLTYRPLFRRVGSRPVFGRALLLRSPKLMELGDRVLIDDFVTLDTRADGAITLGRCVALGRFTSLVCKGEKIHLHDGVNVGSYCRIATQSRIEIGASTLLAAYCYIGPGNHTVPELQAPIIEQQMDIRGGVTIGAGVWIGTRATVLDGVTIGDGAVVGAHALVREDVPAGAIAVGVPARIIGYRKINQHEQSEQVEQ